MTVRPQYHFRQVGKDILIWDVAKLVELAADLPVRHVSVFDIQELDEPYWFAATGDDPTCRRIAEHIQKTDQADLSVPILLCDQNRVMDGMHRVVRALVEGYDSILARVFTQTPPYNFKNVPPDQLPYANGHPH